MKGRILIVEDEPDILELVRYNLIQAGFEVMVTDDGEKALEIIRKFPPELLVLDLMLPGMDGLEVCKLLKQDSLTRELPILILSARKEEVDRIIGFELGADDFLVKPFSPRELVLRVQAILRRTFSLEAPNYKSGDALKAGTLVVHLGAHQTFLNGKPLYLTGTEFKLLVTLMRRRGRVQTRDDLLDTVWGYEYTGYGRTVDTHVRRLREKLGENSTFVETVRGIGYRFRQEVS